MVHLTLRAEPPNLLSDAKWSSERMNSSAAERVHGQSLSFIQWRIQGRDPGGAGHPLFLDQTETRKAEKFFLETGSPLPHLRVWRTWTPLPYYLKVWIWHCYAPINVNPVWGGGVRARGGDLTNFKIFWSNFPGWETKGQSKVSKKTPSQGKKSKTIL